MDEDRDLTSQEQARLLKAARETITSLVNRESPTAHAPDLPGLAFTRGAFVTINKKGRLRAASATSSPGAFGEHRGKHGRGRGSQDPRFPPWGRASLTTSTWRSACSLPLGRSKTWRDSGGHPRHLHHKPPGRGVLLPRVATEYGWDRETFLDQTCVRPGWRLGAGAIRT